MKVAFNWSCESGVVQAQILRAAGEQVGVTIPDSRRWTWCLGSNGIMLSLTAAEEVLLVPALRAYTLVREARCFHAGNENV